MLTHVSDIQSYVSVHAVSGCWVFARSPSVDISIRHYTLVENKNLVLVLVGPAPS